MRKKLAKKTYICPICKISWLAEEWADIEWFNSTSELPCVDHKEHGDFAVIGKPSWIGVAKVDPQNMNAETETKATEYMISEREKAMKTSAKERRWEQDRKKEIMSYKPTWIKRGRQAKDLPKL